MAGPQGRCNHEMKRKKCVKVEKRRQVYRCCSTLGQHSQAGSWDSGIGKHRSWEGLAHLYEANVSRLFTKALAANIEAVLADEAGTVGADAAVFPTWKFFFVRISGNFFFLSPSCSTFTAQLTRSENPCHTCGGGNTTQSRETFLIFFAFSLYEGWIFELGWV